MSILEGYRGGQPVVRDYCLICADEAAPLRLERIQGRPRLRLTDLLALSGLFVMGLALVGDFLLPVRAAGFGWSQRIVTLAATVVVLVAMVLGVDLLALAGAIVLAIAVLADMFGLVQSPGVGWKQLLVLTCGFLCVITAIGLRRRERQIAGIGKGT